MVLGNHSNNKASEMTTSLTQPIYIPGYSPVNSELIICFRGDINYSWLYLASGQKWLTATTLLYFENQLSDFLRISRKYLVNPAHVTHYRLICHKHLMISLSNGSELLVSRRQTRCILAKLQEQELLECQD